MLFASFDFLLFFAVAFALYWALAGRPLARALWVVAASYFFYMASSKPVDGPLPTPWNFVGLLILSTVVDFFCGQRIASARSNLPDADASTARAGTGWLVLSVVANLGLLGYFKYAGFLVEVVADAASLWGIDPNLPVLEILLPIGISFYTFQSLSYTIDVYRGRIPAEASFLRFAFFVSFFPQLVAGPIVRASEFLPQLSERPKLTVEDVDFAVWRISKGLLKKVVLGDFIAVVFADIVFASPAEHSSLENLLALYAFTLQIYADFSGYSDIAIGVARLLGFRIPENFNRPYQAVDVADFWRRWHITLSTWLRDYLYYPLGGSRVGEGRSYLNLWVTMFLVGIWHGASWNFVIYASIQAGAMVFNRACRRQPAWGLWRGTRLLGLSALVTLALALLGSSALRLPNPWPFALMGGGMALFIGLLPRVEDWPWTRPLHILLTVHFSVLSRIFFRADGLEAAREISTKILQWDGLGVRAGMFRIQRLSAWLEGSPALSWTQPVAEWGILILLIAGFAMHYTPSERVERTAKRLIAKVPAVALGVGLAVLAGALSLLLSGPRANIYFVF